MKECIFVDKNGEQLIIRHRKSAIFFLRKADLTREAFKSPFSKGNYVAYEEIERYYVFEDEDFNSLLRYLEIIANEAWKDFEPKKADSIGADHYEYYDKEFDGNGYAEVCANCIYLEGPAAQLKDHGPIVRLYKFNKRKFESFIYDFHESLKEVNT